ncbi:PepSY domain-containing protein [Rhizobium rhizogenes]|uniref:PepSY domain-containing protein n=1 Tax=Rhizobium rhizogenes TaxID=359 RepID=UPI001574738E|nr:PepSY domain-containing protein [Rhizobium rhizogenes]NTI78229.1 PepSY domain-containing protein [Rhizobium rhizogenes]
MKMMIFAAALLGASALTAVAQTSATPSADANTPAVATPNTKNPTAPVAGSNKERIEKAGYSGVTALKLDDKGLWQSNATKDGKSVSVTLDYQGNIVAM